jgi:hypothetical protein
LLPRRAIPRRLKPEPRFPKFRIDNDDPSLAQLITDIAELNLTKARILAADPRCIASKMDSAEPILHCEKIDMAEPSLAIVTQDTRLPNLA